MLVRWSLAACLTFTPPTAAALAQSSGAIRIIHAEQISTAAPKTPHYETHLAVDPRDPKHMIAIASVASVDSNHESNAYVTFDGGKQWSLSAMHHKSLLRGGDGVVYINRDGAAYMALGTRVDGAPKTVISRSTDGGRNWPAPTILPYRDRPWLAFDTTGAEHSIFDGTLYLIGQNDGLMFSNSTDNGKSWSNGNFLNADEGGDDPRAKLSGIVGNMHVGPKAELVAAYVRWSTDATSGITGKDTVRASRVDLLVSETGGRTWHGTRPGPFLHGVTGFRGEEATIIPQAAIDLSNGPHRGRVYLAFSDFDRDLDRFVVRVSHSDDLGKSWESTVASDSTMRGTPSNATVAVNKDGIVAVTWYDRREDPKHHCWRLYGTISTDGEVFRDNTRMSTAATCTNLPGNWIMSAWGQEDDWTDQGKTHPGIGVTAFVPVRFPNGGDTQGLMADREGVFHAAWVNGETGVMQLWHTKFVVDSTVLAELRRTNAAAMSLAGTKVPEGKIDVSSDLRFEASQPQIDFAKGEVVVTVHVRNPTPDRIVGPVQIELARLVTRGAGAMGLADFKVANAENGKDGDGAMWTIKGDIPPGGKSSPCVLRFRFTGGVPDQPQGYFQPIFNVFAAGRK